MTIMLVLDIVDEIGNHPLALFVRHQTERQRQNVRALRTTFVNGRLRIEEPLIKALLDSLG